MAPPKPISTYPMNFPRGEAFSFDLKAFDEALASQGATFEHWRAMRCPAGMIDKNDTNRAVHVDHANCFNGYLYVRVGEVTFPLGNNSNKSQFQDGGVLDGSNATVTIPRFYDGGRDQVYVAPFDRFVLKDKRLLWPHWETFEHNISGVDRLRWPAAQVKHLFDNRMESYHQDVDFEVQGGKIVWTGTRRPGVDPDAGLEQRGRVCTAWYLYVPAWYVSRIAHEGRFVQAEEGGERTTQRMQFQVEVTREYIFESRESDTDGVATDPQDQRRPRDGSFPST